MVYFLCKAYDSDRQNCYFALSLPVRGAWIEIVFASSLAFYADGRSPCGERGLKFDISRIIIGGTSRSPCGERGLKWASVSDRQATAFCRSPCGERGLKLLSHTMSRLRMIVAPRAGSVD